MRARVDGGCVCMEGWSVRAWGEGGCVYGRGGVCVHGERERVCNTEGVECVCAGSGCVYTEGVECVCTGRRCVYT